MRKIAYIGTYPPRQCGIGTFTNNLLMAIGKNIDSDNPTDHSLVVAINDYDNVYDYPPEVKYSVRQGHQRDYVEAAEFINYNKTELCILQHEFGIFGGEMGVYILPLIRRLEVPLMVTFHTILKDPSTTQKSIVQQISEKASKVIVMSNKAIELLQSVYGIKEEKLLLIPHGVPVYVIPPTDIIRKKLKFKGRKVLFTFGLISRNKGIETVIKALPKVVEKHPELLYLVVGNTHPNVLKDQGEEYRNYLIQLIREHDLGNNVSLQRQFLDEQTLFEYLTAADAYVTPYHNEEQITSGTLSYAVGAGTAIVSTPYWHAQELLAEGRGILFDFKKSDQLADILIDLFNSPEQLQKLRQKTYNYGRKLSWSLVGNQYLKLVKKIQRSFIKKEIEKFIIEPNLLPEFSLQHIKRMTDDTGILQHSLYGVPNLREGYCLDDNARALILAVMVHQVKLNPITQELILIYLSFIHYMQNDDGTFRNFLSFNRQYLDDKGSEDSFGRAMWALGYLIDCSPNNSYRHFAQDIFRKAKPNFITLKYQRGIANTMIGVCYYLNQYPDDQEMLNILDQLTTKLLEFYEKKSTEDWKWFEDVITYDNGILPLALFHSARITADEKTLKVAQESMKFLESYTLQHGYLTPVGNDGWFRRGGKYPLYGQQSIDVMAFVLLYHQVYLSTKDKEYLEKMFFAHLWYLGENSLRLPIYDYETNSCFDGLESHGLNLNQGAESTIAYLVSHLTVLKAIEFEHRPKANE
ncbi:MAG: glycosyltransferase family 4 protein [Candidatus Cloacimonetes bacterium]|nr:glycosyltransferase family 4 protein [Candidatus Cloacimonadota bacterium]